ncbi:hypothetical protein H4R19_004726 [Coemansia spiralis]|nr:hypothetical protein H4R19_004726 [Coemansia spiralis]
MPSLARVRAAVLAALFVAIALGWARRAGDAMAATAAVPPAAAPWWVSKRSPLNVYGAKVAWGWTTVLFAAALALCAPARPPRSSAVALARYALATAYWVAMTRWCFGPPLFDRVFVRTGGSCLGPPALPAVASLHLCKQAGGRWSGGHDISGHCFLLLHSAMFLVGDVLAPLLAARPHTAPHRAAAAAAVALLALWGFMLYVTARHFHGAPELLSGVAAGAGYWTGVALL